MKPNRFGACALFAVLVAALGRGTAAATYPVDDSASLPGRTAAVMRWRTPVPGEVGGEIVDGTGVVRFVLNTTPWIGRTGRIYLFLPPQPFGPVRVAWTTQGRLLSGSLWAGQRTLVFAGPIRERYLADTVAISVHADGSRLESDQDLHFQFQIDVD